MPPGHPESTHTTICRVGGRRARVSTRHCSGPFSTFEIRRAWTCADGLGRLERRHDLVGMHGKGESVWLAFSFVTCSGNSPRWRLHDDASFAERCEVEAKITRAANREERVGWPVVSSRVLSTTARRWVRQRNAECQIDSVAQSWSVLSGAGDAERRACDERRLCTAVRLTTH